MYDEFVPNQKGFLKKCNNIYLSDDEIDILKKYNIKVDKYKNLGELIYDIQYMLNTTSSDFSDLELICEHLSERNYYNNTNK